MKKGLFSKARLEKNSMRLIGMFLALMFIMYGLASLGKAQWLVWIPMIFGFFLGGFLFFESRVIDYIKKKGYKSFDVNDVIVLLSTVVAAVLIVNSALFVNIIRNSAPTWLLNFSSTVGVIVAILGLILSVLHFFSRKFK